jgi:kynurenine formamidase
VPLSSPIETRTAPDNPHPAGHRLTSRPEAEAARRAWLEPGDHVTADGLRAAQGVRIDVGDILLVRVGHRRRREEEGPWDASRSRAGPHPAAMESLAERRVAVPGGDGNNDTAPSLTEGVDFPVHVLGIHALGLHFMDYPRFEDLVPLCEKAGHWSLLRAVAPLRLPAATGSPVNPIVIL